MFEQNLTCSTCPNMYYVTNYNVNTMLILKTWLFILDQFKFPNTYFIETLPKKTIARVCLCVYVQKCNLVSVAKCFFLLFSFNST